MVTSFALLLRCGCQLQSPCIGLFYVHPVFRRLSPGSAFCPSCDLQTTILRTVCSMHKGHSFCRVIIFALPPSLSPLSSAFEKYLQRGIFSIPDTGPCWPCRRDTLMIRRQRCNDFLQESSVRMLSSSSLFALPFPFLDFKCRHFQVR